MHSNRATDYLYKSCCQQDIKINKTYSIHILKKNPTTLIKKKLRPKVNWISKKKDSHSQRGKNQTA